MIQNQVVTNVNGQKWNLYAADWIGADGKFSFHFYATSNEHALRVLEEIKGTAVLAGRVEDVVQNDRKDEP